MLTGEEMHLLTRLVEALERIESKLPGRAPVARRLGDAYVSACSFLRVQLRPGPQAWVDVLAAGREFGHSKSTLERARDEVARKQYIDRRWVWRLKEE